MRSVLSLVDMVLDCVVLLSLPIVYLFLYFFHICTFPPFVGTSEIQEHVYKNKNGPCRQVQFGKCNTITQNQGHGGGVTLMIIFVQKGKYTPPYNAHCIH